MMRINPCGDRAVLIDLENLDAVTSLHDAISATPPEGVLELVPALETLLVRFDPARTVPDRLAARLSELYARSGDYAGAAKGSEDVEIPVRYIGEDLDDVAEQTGMDTREVIRKHTEAEYSVAFCGFAPGFAYLTGLDPSLHVGRRVTPRVRIPGGAVALAGQFAGVYPRDSPGGWRLIGHTDFSVWNVDNNPPTRLTPGTRVRFLESSR